MESLKSVLKSTPLAVQWLRHCASIAGWAEDRGRMVYSPWLGI